VLSIYLDDKKDEIVRIKKTVERVMILVDFWGTKTLADVNGKSCRDYVAQRIKQPIRSARPDKTGRPARLVSKQGARRELEDLRAAINHHRKEGLCNQVVEVTLPERGKRRETFLTRSDAARLLWAAWTMKEKQQRTHGKGQTDDKRATRKRIGKHIARFILVGLYTGTRHDAVLGASFEKGERRSWIDMERGVFHRLREGQTETNKRQPPVRLPDRLMLHLRRWHNLGLSRTAIVEWNGKPVKSVKTGFASAVRAAGLDKHVTPHTLRHTASTWLMDEGHKVWTVAGFLGMSTQVLEATYAKHHPDYQVEMAGAFSNQSRKLSRS
jgi:integrase